MQMESQVKFHSQWKTFLELHSQTELQRSAKQQKTQTRWLHTSRPG